MEIENNASFFTRKSTASTTRKTKELTKPLNSHQEDRAKASELAQEAYAVETNPALKNDSAIGIDSSEQAGRLTSEIEQSIENNPSEANNAHSLINAKKLVDLLD